jgi:hypothetical protein
MSQDKFIRQSELSRKYDEVSINAKKEFIKEIEGVKFNCNFDCNGCAKTKDLKVGDRVSIYSKEKGCCTDCYNALGYIRHQPTDEEYKIYTRLFKNNNQDGFWTPNGCSLPRELRSVICLSYSCYDSQVSREDRLKLCDARDKFMRAKSGQWRRDSK